MDTYAHSPQQESLHISDELSKLAMRLPRPWVPDKLLRSFPG